MRPAQALLLLFGIVAGCGDDDGSGGQGGAGAQGASGGGGSDGGGGSGGGSVTRIAFGSCMHQSEPKPVLERARAYSPDLFVFLGDNIYGDTEDMDVLAAKYTLQSESEDLQALLAVTPAIATWDDHDYGRNDAGKEYPFKAESKDLFLQFWEEPEDSPRRTRDGIYTSYVFDYEQGTVQIILLDLRWFRDPLDPNTGQGMNDYVPTTDTSKEFLGEAQWAWLEGELSKPADIRIIGSSLQFSHEYNGYESWTNMPHERQRLIDLIGSTDTQKTIFISGDAHWAELSRQEVADGYPLYDLTSSGITEEWSDAPPNENRIGEVISANNFGFVEIDWAAAGEQDEEISFGIVDVTGAERLRHTISSAELR